MPDDSRTSIERFPHIFTTYTLKGVELRNRIAISGHFAGWWVDKGLPSAEFADYIEERCKNGVGLFVIGATSPEPGSGWMESVSDDIIPRYQMCVERGHRHGAKVFAQLCHPGFRPLPGVPIIASAPSIGSTQPSYRSHDRRVLTQEDLQSLIESFRQAARRAAEGGADGVELHSHESFLHAQMLNPTWNTRTDEYGGSLENRLRFLIETLTAMRQAIGDSLPLGVRLKVDDIEQRGMNTEGYIEAIQRLEALGVVDYVNLTGGDGRFHHGPMPRPEGEWLSKVSEVRAKTNLTLMHAGRIATPEMAESVLAQNIVDVVCMTKTHICDPHFTRKLYENRLEDIRYCTRCLQSCHGKMHLMTCIYNPITSREKAWANLIPADKPKRVVIIGAGPAGMEAALTAAGRGHSVTVLERGDAIGGQILVGASSPLRKNWLRIAEFYARQANKGIFEVQLNMEATSENVLALNPDVVIVATGSTPNRLAVQGGESAFTVHEVIQGRADNLKSVLIFDREGFNRPLVAADYLSSKGISVTFVTSLGSICPTTEGMLLDEMVSQLSERGVQFTPGYELAGWDGAGTVRVRSVQTAEERTFEGIEGIVATVGSSSVNEIARQLRGSVAELYVIGDANTPQTVEQATYQGGRIGREI